MIKLLKWHRIPSEPIRDVLPSMKWSAVEGTTPSSETSALMLYVALNFMATTWTDGNGQFHALAEATYVDLGEATGLSRALISAGLQRLVSLGLIAAEGSHQKRRYTIAWPADNRFFKLPCQAIAAGKQIAPFARFTMRAKHELHAMKLYLYFASIRSNHSFFSMASYETIFEKIRIPERDVRKAVSVLINVGLLVGVDKRHNRVLKTNEPNKYYLTGYEALAQGGEIGATPATGSIAVTGAAASV